MKRVLALIFIILIFVTSFSACTSVGEEAYPLTVNGTAIDGEIFRYYLDSVWNSEEAGGTKDGRITAATHLCIRYVAVNSTFAENSLSLSDSEKVKISDETNVLWNMFGEHYKAIGVSKQTYLKIRTSEAYIEKLRFYFFDTGGSDEISDAALRGVLMENYVSFKYVKTPLYTTDVYGNEMEFSQDDVNLLNSLFNSAVATANKDFGIEKAYSSISEKFPLTEQSYETVVIDRNDHKFSSVFYDTVKEMTEGTATVFQYQDSVYLVYRIHILGDGTIFADKRNECLISLSEIPLQSKINVLCNQYQSVRNSSAVSEYYSKVANNR